MKRTLFITGALAAALAVAATALAPANAKVDASGTPTANISARETTGQRTRFAQYNCMHFMVWCRGLCLRRQDYRYCHNMCMIQNGCRPIFL
jgi:hypothetical protein